MVLDLPWQHQSCSDLPAELKGIFDFIFVWKKIFDFIEPLLIDLCVNIQEILHDFTSG